MSGKRSLILRYFPVNDNEQAQFLLIFHHNTMHNKLFTSYQEFLNTNSLDKYSIFGYISDDFKTENAFEFIMEYPETKKYSHWRQKINPIEANEPDNIGFEEIETTWDTNQQTQFIGLHKSERTNKCYVEGATGLSNQGNPNYYYAIGLFDTWSDNKLPAYISTGEKSNLHEVYLWLKITNLNLLSKIPLIKTCCIIRNTHKIVYIIIFIIIIIKN